jgi:hypothetical protein
VEQGRKSLWIVGFFFLLSPVSNGISHFVSCKQQAHVVIPNLLVYSFANRHVCGSLVKPP